MLRSHRVTSVSRENKVKVAAMSMSASAPDGDDSTYLEWHQLDHMPEQYQIPGLLYAQRWASTPACRAARIVESERFAAVNHVVQYLFGEPVAQAIDDWFVLGARLHEVGRFPYRLPAVLLGAFDVVSCHAAPRAQVTDEIVPYRPNRGAYVVIERPADDGAPCGWTPDQVKELLAVDGVAGLWTFAANAELRADRFDPVHYQVAVCYLDGDPVAAARPIGDIVTARWDGAAVTPELAAPFESMRAFEWDRFRNPG
jgi:hypothetical protein